MSTPAEQIATGPYWVEKSNSVWVIMGPDGRWPWHFTSEEAALLRAKDLTIAYTRGQQDAHPKEVAPTVDRITSMLWEEFGLVHAKTEDRIRERLTEILTK